MTKLLTIVAAILLIIHGLIHLMGTAVYASRAGVKGLPYKTTLLSGRWNLGKTGIRIFGWLWLLPAIGFVTAAAALLAGQPSWKPLLVAVTLLSLVLTVLDWSSAFLGAVINIGILALVLLAPRIVSQLF